MDLGTYGVAVGSGLFESFRRETGGEHRRDDGSDERRHGDLLNEKLICVRGRARNNNDSEAV